MPEGYIRLTDLPDAHVCFPTKILNDNLTSSLFLHTDEPPLNFRPYFTPKHSLFATEPQFMMPKMAPYPS